MREVTVRIVLANLPSVLPVGMSDRRLQSYTNPRSGLLAMIPPLPPDGHPVLDVGCSDGATGHELTTGTGVRVIGVELDPALAAVAERRLDRVVVGDATTAMQELVRAETEVAAVIFGDVLEHLVDPWTCVDLAHDLMPDGGWIVASVPNVAHHDTLFNLLRGTWPMRERGIHDDTHLRFFARRDLPQLLARDRSTIEEVRRVYRIVERPHRLNRFAGYVGRLWPNGFTFQYLVRVSVRPKA